MITFTISSEFPGLIISYDEQYYEKIKGGVSKRMLEKSSVRLLLEKNGFQSEINYTEGGSPFLVGNQNLHLSISHSHGWYAIMVSKNKCGVDIELFSERLSKARDYFCNLDEAKFVARHDLQLIWGVKEAIYKCFDGQIDDLRNDVTVESIDDKTINVRYLDATHICHYEVKDNVYLVVVSL